MNQQKQITIIVIAAITALAAGFYFNTSPVLRYGIPAVLLGLYTTNYIIQNKKLPSRNEITQTQKHDAETILKNWARKKDLDITIHWEYTDFGTKELRDWDQELQALVGVVDQLDYTYLFFVETRQGDVKGKKKIRHPDEVVYPYKYSDHFQEYKRKTRSGRDPGMNWQNQQANRNGQVPPWMGGGMQVQGRPPNMPKNQGQTQEEEDTE